MEIYNKSLLHFDGANGSTVIENDAIPGIEWAAVGNAQLDTSVYKFGISSLLLGGSVDCIVSENSAFILSDSDFTIEMWVYPTLLNLSFHVLWTKRGSSSNFSGLLLHLTSSNTLVIFGSSNNSGWDIASGFILFKGITINNWYHIVFQRSGNLFTSFVNGKAGNSIISTSSFSNNRSALSIGSELDNQYGFKGNIDEFRFMKGKCEFPYMYNLPTAEYSTDSYTKTLLHLNGDNNSTTITDESGKTWVAAGDAKLTTSYYKFGNSCITFDGSGDSIYAEHSDDFNFGSGDFTIDFWVKTTTTTQCTLVGKIPSGFASGMWVMLINYVTAGDIVLYLADYSSGAAMLSTVGGISNTGEWIHIALVRNGNHWGIFKDAVCFAGLNSETTIADLTGRVYFGQDQAYGRNYNGLMDEIRISKGIARFTTNFTPSTDAYNRHKNYLNSGKRNKLDFFNVTGERVLV